MRRTSVLILLSIFVGISACTSAAPTDLSREEALKYFEAGNQAYNQQDYKSAYKNLLTAYENDIEHGTLFFRLGYCAETVQDDLNSARKYYEEALAWYAEHPNANDENYKKAYKNYGTVYFLKGNEYNIDSKAYRTKQLRYYQKTKEIWDEGLAKHPDNQYIKSEYNSVTEAIAVVKQELKKY